MQFAESSFTNQWLKSGELLSDWPTFLVFCVKLFSANHTDTQSPGDPIFRLAS